MLKGLRTGGVICVAGILVGTFAGALVNATGAAAASPSSHAVHQSYFEKNSSFTYTTSAGVSQDRPPQGPPAANSQIEFTDLDFRGTFKHHLSAWAATDHFVCVFNAQDVPACDGEIAIGGSLLLLHGTGGQGTFSIPVVGGTGDFLGDHGAVKVMDLGETLNANLQVSASS